MTAAECLGIDQQLVRNLALIYRNYAGDASTNEIRGKEPIEIRSSWTRAGFLYRAASYAAVAEEKNLSTWFQDAAEAAGQASTQQQKAGAPPTWLFSAIEMHLLSGRRDEATILLD